MLDNHRFITYRGKRRIEGLPKRSIFRRFNGQYFTVYKEGKIKLEW